MDLTDEKNATIFYLKFLKAIIVTQDLKSLLDMAENLGIDYTSVELLKMLEDFTRQVTASYSLPEESAHNIYSFLNICRFTCREAENQPERIELCNSIIGYLNSSKTNPPYRMYEMMINSYYVAFLDQLKFHISYALNPDAIKLLLSSVVELEYLILFMQSNLVEIDEFIEDFGEDLVLSQIYLLATDHLIREYPELLRDKTYVGRLRFVLDNNEMLLREHQGQPAEECVYELDSDDTDALEDKRFWKLHHKIKKMVNRAQKNC